MDHSIYDRRYRFLQIFTDTFSPYLDFFHKFQIVCFLFPFYADFATLIARPTFSFYKNVVKKNIEAQNHPIFKYIRKFFLRFVRLENWKVFLLKKGCMPLFND